MVESINSVFWLWMIRGCIYFIFNSQLFSHIWKQKLLNSVPLSDKIQVDPLHLAYTWLMYVHTTALVDLDFTAIQKVYPVYIHTTVRTYQFPAIHLGWNSPIKTTDINYMGILGAWKCKLAYFIICLFLCWHVLHCFTYLWTIGLTPFQ